MKINCCTPPPFSQCDDFKKTYKLYNIVYILKHYNRVRQQKKICERVQKMPPKKYAPKNCKAPCDQKATLKYRVWIIKKAESKKSNQI
jgi:hypothetical protein